MFATYSSIIRVAQNLGPIVVSELRIREIHGPDVPILLLTADGRGPAKASQVGAYALLSKPFDLNELLVTIQRGLAPSTDLGG